MKEEGRSEGWKKGVWWKEEVDSECEAALSLNSSNNPQSALTTTDIIGSHDKTNTLFV